MGPDACGDLQALGVQFDVYFLESSLYTSSKVEKTLGRLVAAGHTYEREGALWLKTTDFGDDKDRVMRKRAEKGGEYTYFLPDVAYHVDKWERGFARAINVQGADHHNLRLWIGPAGNEIGRDVPIFRGFGQFYYYILTLWEQATCATLQQGKALPEQQV